MQSMLDRSQAVCRVCGDRRSLDRDARAASAELVTFSAAHGIHDSFLVDVVVAAPSCVAGR